MDETEFDTYFAALADLDNASWHRNPLPASQKPAEPDDNKGAELSEEELCSHEQRERSRIW